jgi:AAA15 family ATPase/GTPase
MVLYGYNAAGKSNILSALKFLRWFWFYKSDNPDDGTLVEPFKMDVHSRNKPSSFELIFYVDGVKYWYQLELDVNQVLQERLYFYKSVQPTKLFERTLDGNQSKIWFAPKVIKLSSTAKEQISLNCLKNMSFFAARNQVNANIPQVDAAMDWMKTKVMQTIFPDIDLTGYAQRKTSDNRELITYILDFLHEADFNITNIKTEIISQTISDELTNMVLDSAKIPDEEKERIKKEKTIKKYQTGFEHTVENERGIETYLFSFENNEESRGTIRTFGLESALYNVIQRNAFLAIDEAETSLHPKLLEKILYEYLKSHSKSQILVTTHNDGLLDLVDDLIRKDSVWFSEKDKAGVTDLYKLTDFRGVNRLSSIREAYRNKRFGATMK